MAFFKTLSDWCLDYREWATGDHPRIPLGYEIMDSRTSGGAAAGEVILYQARSGVGKTAMAGNWFISNPDRAAIFFSLEMHGRYVVNRLAAMHTGVQTAQIEYDLKTTGRSEALQRLVDDFPYLTIVDKPAMSLKDMGQAINECEDVWERKVEMVAIDFLELVTAGMSLSSLDKIDALSRKVKDFARERDLVTMLLHQVGRGEGGEGDQPLGMGSSRYGGEVSADYVIGAYRPCLRRNIPQEDYLRERWHIYLQLLKTRGGPEIHPEGVLHKFDPFTLRITEWDYTPRPLWEDQTEPVLEVA